MAGESLVDDLKDWLCETVDAVELLARIDALRRPAALRRAVGGDLRRVHRRWDTENVSSIRTAVTRIRSRVAGLGLSLRSARQRGVVLAAASDAPGEH